LIKLTELASVSIVRYLWRIIIASKKVEDWDSSSSSGGYVITANHTAGFDPFVITSNLRWKHVRLLTPYFFMTHNRFFKPLFRPWFYLHGCFPAFKHPKMDYGISRAEHLLKDGRTVLMFPEGGVSRTDRARLPKTGIEHLVRIDGVKVLPARVRWNRNKKFFRSYSLSIGQPFDAKNMTAEQIMDVVYSLKFR